MGSGWSNDRHHAVCFYERDEHLADEVGTFVSGALVAGGTAILVATPEHRLALEQQVVQMGNQQALGRDQIVVLDAGEALGRFTEDGWPDRVAFDASIGELVRGAGAAGGPVHVYGEMVAVLWDQGLVAAALELEAAWNDLAEHTEFSLLCGYRRAADARNGDAPGFDEVCGLHSLVVDRPELATSRAVTQGPLRVSVAEGPESTVVTLAGTFTAAEVPGFTTAVKTTAFTSTVVLDLSNLSAIDADGTHCLDRLARRLAGATLIAWAPRPPVCQALADTRLDQRFHVTG